ncbi:hypothetical protein FO519_003825 [Halicephalobus sp. NKZ332]|nr:hypothetical protein FO519_003825 [Halicephalobus sp. NKZ332]
MRNFVFLYLISIQVIVFVSGCATTVTSPQVVTTTESNSDGDISSTTSEIDISSNVDGNVNNITSDINVNKKVDANGTSVASESRRRRDFEDIELDENHAIISVLTFFKFGAEPKNFENADKIEEQRLILRLQLKEFISSEQVTETKFGKYKRRVFEDETGYLRIVYILSKAREYCSELIQLAIKAINLSESVASGEVTCNGQVFDAKKID